MIDPRRESCNASAKVVPAGRELQGDAAPSARCPDEMRHAYPSEMRAWVLGRCRRSSWRAGETALPTSRLSSEEAAQHRGVLGKCLPRESLDPGCEHVAIDSGPVDAAVGWMGVVLDAELYRPGEVVVGQPGRKL